MPAEIAEPVIVNAGETNREAEVASAEETVTPEPKVVSRPLRGVMHSLGLPEDIQAELEKRAGLEPEAEVDEAELEVAEPETEAEGEDEEEGEAEAEESPVGDPKIQGLIKAKDKYRHQRNDAREKAADLEKENTELKAKLEDKPPVVVASSWEDPLSHVNNEQELESELKSARAILSFYRKNPNGWEGKDGSIITPEQVVDKTEEMERIISEHVPRKQEELRVRPQFTAQAKALVPTMFDRSHQDYQLQETILKEFPQLAKSPKRDLGLAYTIIGIRYVEAMAAQQQAQAKNGGKKIALPPELEAQNKLRGKVPHLKSNPPSRNNGNSAPKPKPRNEVLQGVLADNSSANLGRAMREMRGQTNESGRRAVTV